MLDDGTTPEPLLNAANIPPPSEFSIPFGEACKCPWTGEWSWGTSPRDVTPKRRTGNLSQFCEDLVRVHWMTVKDGPVCIAATFKDGSGRRKDAINGIWLLGFDVDDGQEGDAERILKANSSCVVLHSTFRNGEVRDGRTVLRFRIFLPLSRSVTIEEHQVLWRWASDRFSAECGEAIDPAAKDPGRLFYTMRNNGHAPWLHVQPGLPLNPDNLPDGSCVRSLLEARSRKKLDDARPSDEAIGQAGGGHLANFFLRRAVRSVEQAESGERNSTLNCQAFTIGQYVGAGLLDRDAASKALVEAGLVAGLPNGEAEDVVSRALQAGELEPCHPSRLRPKIVFSQGSDLSDRAWTVVQHLAEINDPPYLFRRDRDLVRLIRYKDEPYIEVLSTSALRTVIMELARFAEERPNKDGKLVSKGCDLPLTIAEYISNLDGLPLPRLDAVVQSPIFTPTGKLLSEDGYDPELGVYVALGGASIQEIPVQPTESDVEWARDLLIGNLLQGFPFVGKASLAHALAIGLLPFVRFMIDGPTPLHLISAPSAGSGKSLLAEALALISTGREPELMPESKGEEEFRKHGTAKLDRNSIAFILLDNVSKRIAGSNLASMITSTVWEDRRLGQSSVISVRNLATWVATANEPKSSSELARRIVWCHLDSRVENPWARDEKEFKHHPLIPWVRKTRSDLLRAFLILVQNAVSRGMPKSSTCIPKGSFEDWAYVMSSVLDCAGIPGFLENQSDFYEHANDEAAEWIEFVRVWSAAFGDFSVGSHQLSELAINHGLLVHVIRDGSANAQSMRMAKALKARLERVIGGFRLTLGEYDGHRKAQRYRLVPPETDGFGPAVGHPPQPGDELYERISREARSAAGLEPGQFGLGGNIDTMNTPEGANDRNQVPRTPAEAPFDGYLSGSEGLAGSPVQPSFIPNSYRFPVNNHWDDN